MRKLHLDIPAITTEQMRQVDRLMIETYHIGLKQMMENAGLSLATLGRDRFLNGNPRGKRVVVLAGRGGNGGGGLVTARRLHSWGAKIEVFLTLSPDKLRGTPADQLGILKVMQVPIYPAADIQSLPQADLILDAIIGYSLSGAPRGAAAHLIELANQNGAPILSLDTPSGLDTTSGTAYQPHIRAAATLTLALPKKGLLVKSAREIGELYLADISVPPDLYQSLGLEVGPIFAEETIIRLR